MYIHEKQIARRNYETAYLLTPDGELIFKKRGTTKSVKFSWYQLARMPGNILTHNHVFEEEYESYGLASAVSSSDIKLAWVHRLAEIRMVLGDIRYSFKWADVVPREADDLVRRLQILEVGYRASLDKIEESLYNLEYTSEDAFNRDYYNMIRKNAEDVNVFFETNMDIGYIYNREVVRWKIQK